MPIHISIVANLTIFPANATVFAKKRLLELELIGFAHSRDSFDPKEVAESPRLAKSPPTLTEITPA
jgi:hypothetical protein